MRRIFEQKRQPNNKLLEKRYIFSLSGIVFVCFGGNESHWYIYVYRTTCSMFINAFHARLNKLRMRTGHQTSSYEASQPAISPPVQINLVSACCCFRGDWAVWKMCYSSSTHNNRMETDRSILLYNFTNGMDFSFLCFNWFEIFGETSIFDFHFIMKFWFCFFGTDFSPHTI